MTRTTNAQTLLMRIFDSWRTENLPDVPDSTAFEIFASELALRQFGLLLEDVQAGIVGGGQDGCIDSIYVFFDDALLDEDSDVTSHASRPADFPQGRALELWIVQAKRTASFAELTVEKLENSLRRLLDLSQSIDSLASLYNSAVLNRIGVFRQAWEKLVTRRPKLQVNVVYATPGDTRGTSPPFEAKLVALKAVIQGAIPDADKICVELMGAAELLARFNERPSYSLSMKYQESATSGQSHVALVHLVDYYDLIVDENGRLRRYLFEWNVRDYQGNVEVNKGIRSTLADTGGPEFWWLNNGVTILCSDATSAGKTYSLSNIQIVNGLQTSHEIYEALKGGGGGTRKTERRMLLVRVIVTDDPVTRDQVIRATNRQTAVTDASLRATDEVQRNIESYFLTKGWYYDRRKNYYKNEGKDPAKIVGIPLLGAAITAMGLARPDKSRGKPSSLLKNDDDYESVFDSSINLETYFWAARTQRKVDSFIVSEAADATVSQRSNLRYHLAMLVAEKLNSGPVRRPHQLHNLAIGGRTVEHDELLSLFNDLKQWSNSYLEAEGVILERATKAQRFSEYLLRCAGDCRDRTRS